MSQVKKPSPQPTARGTVTQKKIDKRINAGDGQGVREDYVPWIKVRAIASKGNSHMVPGVRVQRTHHLLSNAEYHYHVILEYDRSIIDIREQFPLFPQSETHAIATSLNFRPPLYPGTDVPLVMTTDFLVTKLDENGTERLVARSMKYAKEIQDARQEVQDRILENLDIERLYWERRGIEWKLVLYENLSQNHIRNLLALRSYAAISPQLASEKNIRNVLTFVECASTDSLPLKTLLKKISKFIYIDYISVKHLFFHLLWTRLLEFDSRSKLISLAEPLCVKVSSSQQISVEARHA